jgi:hypothetical protein
VSRYRQGMDRQFLLANVLLRADPGEGEAMNEELKPCSDIAERLDGYAVKMLSANDVIVRGTSTLVADLILAAAEIRRLRADRDAVLEEAARLRATNV